MTDLATLSSRRNAGLCALLTGLCIAAVYPVATVPFSDDFSYTKTALEFANTGRFLYNGWATAMLGWQVIWGALFIKLFGFSFTVVRLSTTPVSMATVYLFHQILVRFGINSSNAAYGALTLGTSPLFIFLAASYMTDVPGLFVLVLCLYMCQRAVVAVSGRAAFAWLISAALVNMAGGTVRQTSWLGALIIVPSAGWLLRRQRHMFLLVATLVLASLATVFLCMHWANRQPFFVPEPVLVDRRFFRGIWYLLGEFGKGLLCLTLVLLPLLAGWITAARRLGRAALVRVALGTSAYAVALASRAHHGQLDNWVMPWLIPVLQTQGMVGPDPLLGGVPTLPLGVRTVLSVLIAAAALIVAEQIIRFLRQAAPERPIAPMSSAPRTWQVAVTLTVPFILIYLVLLVPRASTSLLQDRYLLGIIPPLIVLLLLTYQRWFSRSLPAFSGAFLVAFACYAIGANHNLYAYLRAEEQAVRMLQSRGVQRTSIIEGFAADGWVQLQVGGYFNSANMVLASRYYNPHVPAWDLPPGCASYLPQAAEPVIHPRYVITGSLTQCVAPTDLPVVTYTAWLPPFDREVFVEQLKRSSP